MGINQTDYFPLVREPVLILRGRVSDFMPSRIKVNPRIERRENGSQCLAAWNSEFKEGLDYGLKRIQKRMSLFHKSLLFLLLYTSRLYMKYSWCYEYNIKSLQTSLVCCTYKNKLKREGARHSLVVRQDQVGPVNQLSPKQRKKHSQRYIV